jgi:catechol 2,3-dioxygenase-like lactoylglutathione lyase family enzyme
MISPQFVVPDVVRAAEYYRDVLGFRIRGYFLDPPVFAIVARDSVEIHFGRADAERPPLPNGSRRQGGLDAYIWVNDLDSLHRELKARGKDHRGARIDGLQVL